MDIDDMDKFIRTIKRKASDRDKAVFGFLIAGLSAEEVVTLKGADVTGQGRRTQVRGIALGKLSGELIQEHCKNFSQKENFFANKSGSPLTVRTIQLICKRYALLARIEPEKLTPSVLGKSGL